MNPGQTTRSDHHIYRSDDALNVATRAAVAHARIAHDATTGPRRLHDPSGLTTGRYTLRRHVFVTVDGKPAVWCWRVQPEPARGVDASQVHLAKSIRDFTAWDKALAYAIGKARENIR